MAYNTIKIDAAIEQLVAEQEKKNNFELPSNHKPGMPVPKGGSSCASCEYYKGDMQCGNEYFTKWNGSENIPAESADAYCTDWYEPKEEVENEEE